MIKWHLETHKLKDLKPHPKNPRKLSKHDAEHLQKSLDKFGLIDKPIITAQGIIIGGHQRVALLKKSKTKEVECWVPDQALSEQDIDELNIRLNRAQGEWDFDLLANQWEADSLLEWGFLPDDLLGAVDVEGIDEKEVDESILDGINLIAKFKIEIPEEDAASFENQLDDLLKRFPRAKKTKNL